jgi:iron complex outermembrane receptor protein
VTTGLQAAPFAEEKGKFDALTWDATADYHWNDQVMTYLAVRRGYKTGGFNLPAPPPPLTPTFGPEHVIDLEAGLKGDWNIGSVPLRTNVAAFHDWYDNAQVEIPVGVGGVETVTESTGRATIYGGEFEGTVVPVDGLTLSAFASIDHARFDDKCTPALNKAETACGQFPFVPETKYGFSGQWNLPVPDHIGTVTLNADYSWIDKVLTQDKTAPLGSYPSYALVNLRVDWQMFDWGVTASAFVTNATNKTYIQGGYPLDSQVGFESVIYGAPRMFGFSLAYKFNEQ